jgi:hypothetical protein
VAAISRKAKANLKPKIPALANRIMKEEESADTWPHFFANKYHLINTCLKRKMLNNKERSL